MKNSRLFLSIFLFIIIFTIPATAISAEPQKIPVVVLFKNNLSQKHFAMVKSNGGEINKVFKIIHGYAANLPPDLIEKLKKDPDVASIDNDIQVKALDTVADIQIRANQTWATSDTGQGVTIAILDTGIAVTHPEFSGRILKCHSEVNLIHPFTCNDQNGHGTHTAGIAAASGVNSKAKGVAPKASLYIDQVLDSTGSGSISQIISGIEWAVNNNAKIISMSLGTSPLTTTQSNCDNVIPSLTSAINNAVSSGVTVVAAAGNSGTQGLGAPGCISSTIAVGAVDSTDTVASFSSRGGAMKDHGISAPGVNIFSSVPTGKCQLCDPSGYAILSGTSMATPHVAGTVALMLEANHTLLPATIKNALFNTACTSSSNPSCPTGSVPNSNYGTGRVDAFRFLGPMATTLSLGAISSPVPWGANIKATGTLVYSNGTGIGGKTITFTGTGAGNLAPTVTNSDGTFLLSGLAPSTIKTGWTVQAHFAGDVNFKPSDSSSVKYNTIRHGTALTLNIIPNTAKSGNIYLVNGTLTDTFTHTRVASQTITFNATSPIVIGNTITDLTGTYAVTGLTTPSAGSYQISSHYAGNSLYRPTNPPAKTLNVT